MTEVLKARKAILKHLLLFQRNNQKNSKIGYTSVNSTCIKLLKATVKVYNAN